MKRYLITLSLIAAAAMFPSSATAEAPRAKIRDVYAIHFVLDGTNLETFNKTLSEGRLPTIEECFIKGGARFTHGLSLFPTTSTTIYQAYTSGLFPGHAGIPHLQRFERKKWRLIDYLTADDHDTVNTDFINLRALLDPETADLDAPTTIFELLKGYPTATVYSPFYRGATEHRPSVPIRALWSTYVSGREEHVDVLAYRDVMDLFEGTFEDIPRYSLIGLYSPDILGHKYGPHSKEVADVLVQFDLFLKDFLGLLDKRGIADKTYIIVTADHGMHKTGKLFNLKKALEERGVFVKPKNPKIDEYTLVAADRGVVSTHIYVKHDGGFEPIEDPESLRRHPSTHGGTVDLIDAILGLDATEFLVVRAGERNARIFNHEGKAADVGCTTIDFADYCSYDFDVLKGDPLGYSSSEKLKGLLDGLPHSTHRWKKETADEIYPDAVIQLSQIFRDGRAGDAFITTRNRYGFRKVKQGNHGGIIDGDMRVPFLISGPTVPKGDFGVARPVDIYALLIDWFGLKQTPRNHDGANPFSKAQGEDNRSVELAALDLLFEKHPSINKMIDVPYFVREKVAPVIKAQRFKDILGAAVEEEKHRSKIVSKIASYLDALKRQKNDENAEAIADPAYLDDHIDIANRALKRAKRALLRMDDIIKVLRHCQNPSSTACLGL